MDIYLRGPNSVMFDIPSKYECCYISFCFENSRNYSSLIWFYQTTYDLMMAGF